MAEVDGSGVQVRFRNGNPQVELIPRGTALEALKRISCQMDRENATLRGSGAVDRAWATPLVAVSLTRHEADQCKDIPHGNLLSNGLKIDAWQ
jgi:hypothetical protein